MARLQQLDRTELHRRAEALHQECAEQLNCSERVFLVMHRLLETEVPAQAVCMMSGFGGGVGGTRDNLCGAITGGVAAIGLLHGRPNPPEGSREDRDQDRAAPGAGFPKRTMSGRRTDHSTSDDRKLVP